MTSGDDLVKHVGKISLFLNNLGRVRTHETDRITICFANQSHLGDRLLYVADQSIIHALFQTNIGFAGDKESAAVAELVKLLKAVPDPKERNVVSLNLNYSLSISLRWWMESLGLKVLSMSKR